MAFDALIDWVWLQLGLGLGLKVLICGLWALCYIFY
jgi:hypothetical protein